MNESTIYKKLNDFFKPEILKVNNDSHMHSGHAGSPNTGNSHFSIIIKSDKLKGLSRLQGQRKIHELLSREFKAGLHALSIKIIF